MMGLKLAYKDFNEVWIIDLKGNARTSGELRRKEGYGEPLQLDRFSLI